ncbi:hypothetical protein HF329_21235 [Chitinophaga oryzae]|uniref:Uncharacterized protein n=1 Tax=Chitinophaga oryzae TaxID=2725414 RepID=A0AAE6ZIN1_9BACT|nr:hypothetical protein [Chitinophaga oryzae]QJB33701.1 hypothetical protein HF329_21235 [Chitinophaga oryzae]
MKTIILNLLLVFIIFLSFNACRKSEATLSFNQTGVITVEEARQWYLSNSSSGINPILGKPQWDQQLTVDLKNGQSILKIGIKMQTESFWKYRELLFNKDSGRINNCVVWEVWVEPGYLYKKQQLYGDSLELKNYVQNEDFSGLIYLYDFEGRFIKGRKYTDGDVVADVILKKNNNGALRPQLLMVDCKTNPNGPGCPKKTPALTGSEEEWGTPVFHEPIVLPPPPPLSPPTTIWINPVPTKAPPTPPGPNNGGRSTINPGSH